jgi:hypothetical protein
MLNIHFRQKADKEPNRLSLVLYLLFFIFVASSYSFVILIVPPFSLSQTNAPLYQTFETKK